MRKLSFETVNWPAKGEFRISRSALTEFVTVQVSITQDGHVGRAECRPYARYNETAETVSKIISEVRSSIETGCSRIALQTLLPAGAARNVLDCALWDLEAKRTGTPVWKRIGLPRPKPRETAFTLSLDRPENMAAAARQAQDYKVLKLKIGNRDGLDSISAILTARPDAKLIIDANEALSSEELAKITALSSTKNIAMIEQPFTANRDHPNMFAPDQSPIICADESLHSSIDLQAIWEAGYRAVNVKLDKTGGLTEAVKTMRLAKEMGFVIMAGCMVGSSLAMAPMMMLESLADYIDLDGPLLLNDDVDTPLKYKGGKVFPPSKDLWG